jgi:hypothetical protein
MITDGRVRHVRRDFVRSTEPELPEHPRMPSPCRARADACPFRTGPKVARAPPRGRRTPRGPAQADLLAGQAPPARAATEAADPELSYVLHEVAATTPGFMSDELGGLIAQNRLNVLLFGELTGANLVRLWFTEPGWRDRLDPPEQQADTSLAYVADLRAAAGRRGGDPEAAALVAELRAAGKEFAEMWDRHPVSALHCSAKVVHDARVGRLDLECSVLTSASSRQRLLLMKAAPGTPTADRLAALSTYS